MEFRSPMMEFGAPVLDSRGILTVPASVRSDIANWTSRANHLDDLLKPANGGIYHADPETEKPKAREPAGPFGRKA